MKGRIGSTLGLALASALGLWGGGGGEAQAQPPTIEVREVRGQPVVVNGRELKLHVFVFPAKPPSGGTPAYCTNGDQPDVVPHFANAKTNGLSFNINQNSIPSSIVGDATGAVHAAFVAWDGTVGPLYFTVNDTGGASGPAADGNNTVGWAKLVPPRTLAATWVWTDATNHVVEADIFYNTFHPWEVLTDCNVPSGKYDVGAVGTHEIGHAVGLDHLSDPNAYATMYPSAAKGEIKKRTPTAGDKDGYVAAGGY